MSHIDQTISDLRMLLHEQEQAVRGTKVTINGLLKMAGREPAYSEAELVGVTEAPIANISRDRWYGKPLATAIREYLTMRRTAGMGPATVAEIYDALKSGGFQFEAKNDDYAKRGLRSSLTKNPTTFHRLPDGRNFGLTEWYPAVRVEGASKGGTADDDDLGGEN